MANTVNPSRVDTKAPDNYRHKARVWDLPTRLFHWLLVLLVGVSFVTGKLGGTAMRYHEWSGAVILLLVQFRLLWGIVGGEHARFKAFVRRPRAVVGYLRSLFTAGHEQHLGHNPLGGWSIIAMLAALSIQAGTGLFANDDIFTEGPLAYLVSGGLSDWLTQIHRINQGILVVLIGIHIFAVVFYLTVKGENLVKPMFTGYKHWREPVSTAESSPIRAILITVILAAVVYLVLYG